MSLPVLTPDSCTREGSWDNWLDHFQTVAEVNKYNNAAKLLWLQLCMTGRAQTALHSCQSSGSQYPACIKGLRESFDLHY